MEIRSDINIGLNNQIMDQAPGTLVSGYPELF